MEQNKHDEGFVGFWESSFPRFPGVNLKDYKSLNIFLYDTLAGNLPVIHAQDRAEFEDLFCKIYYRGEKKHLPESMGAAMIKGWRDLLRTPHRVILLSDGYYSGISPEDIGLPANEWKEKSFTIRLNHEACHYYTLRMLGFMENCVEDEAVADAMGITQAFGKYHREYFLRFLGLEQYPTYRLGRRLENYLPKGFKGECSDWVNSETFEIMKNRAMELSAELEQIIHENMDRPELMQTLASFLMRHKA